SSTNKKSTNRRIEEAKHDYAELGGWQALKSGEWLPNLIQRSFNNYWERANAEYFRKKYPNSDTQEITKKLIGVAAKNASLLGGITGAAISADEIAALGSAGISLPANLTIGLAAISVEAIGLIRLQLQLIANLAKLYGAPLDPGDPE